MEDDLKARLEGLFEIHNSKQRQQQKAVDERALRQAEFLERFYTATLEVFIPAFEELTAFARSKGLDARVDVGKEGIDGQGRPRAAYAAIRFYMGKDLHRPAHEYPHLTIMCEKSSLATAIHKSTIAPGAGGQGGPVGQFQLDILTKEFLQQKVVELLQEILV